MALYGTDGLPSSIEPEKKKLLKLMLLILFQASMCETCLYGHRESSKQAYIKLKPTCRRRGRWRKNHSQKQYPHHQQPGRLVVAALHNHHLKSSNVLRTSLPMTSIFYWATLHEYQYIYTILSLLPILFYSSLLL